MKLVLGGHRIQGLGEVSAVVTVVDGRGTILHSDKANLSSASSRKRLAKRQAEQFPDLGDASVIEQQLLGYLNAILKGIEEQKPTSSVEGSFSVEELAQGTKLLGDPDLLKRLIDIVNKTGHTGETLNKKALVLAGVSSRFDKDVINICVKGSSAVGKSFLTKAVLGAMPSEWVCSLTRITANALFYLKGKDLSHKILFIDEVAGTDDSNYSLRIGISEGELSVLVPVKNSQNGGMETEEIRVPAKGMVFLTTTTKLSLDAEMETRLLSLFPDESQQHTIEILEAEASEVDEEDARRWQRVAQAALWQLQPSRVTVPFALVLAKRFPHEKLRARRDFPKFLSFIKASALLHQEQRHQNHNGAIVADFKDYEIAREVCEVVLAQTLKELSPQEETIVDKIKEHFPQDREFSVKELFETLPQGLMSNQRLKNIIGQLKEKGVVSWNEKKGWGSKYLFVEDPRGKLELPSAEELSTLMPPGDHVTESDGEGGSDVNELGHGGVLPNVTDSVTIGNTPVKPTSREDNPNTEGTP